MAKQQTEVCRIFCGHTSEFEAYLLQQTGSRDEAADAAQEIYLRLIQLDDLQRIERPRSYLFRSAVNLMRDRHRRRKTHSADFHVSIDDMELPSPALPVDEGIADKEQLNLFESAVYQLSDKQRRAFLLHRFGEYTHAEIAAEMGISVSYVEKLTRSAVSQLRVILGGQDRKTA